MCPPLTGLVTLCWTGKVYRVSDAFRRRFGDIYFTEPVVVWWVSYISSLGAMWDPWSTLLCFLMDNYLSIRRCHGDGVIVELSVELGFWQRFWIYSGVLYEIQYCYHLWYYSVTQLDQEVLLSACQTRHAMVLKVRISLSAALHLCMWGGTSCQLIFCSSISSQRILEASFYNCCSFGQRPHLVKHPCSFL